MDDKPSSISFSYCFKDFAVVSAICAIFPLKCPAASKGKAAELTFWVGGMLGDCHRNDTNAAKRSRVATAMQFMSAAADLAVKLSGVGQAIADMRGSPNNSCSFYILNGQMVHDAIMCP